MKENKIGIIVCSLLVLVSGVLPLFFLECATFVNYMLAVFGSGLLSLIICITNYFVFKKKLLIEIIQDDFYLELQSKIQVEITSGKRNQLTLSQLIKFCATVRSLYSKVFDKIDLYLSGVFCRKQKGNRLIVEYRNVLSKSYKEYNDMYLFLTTTQDSDIEEIKEEFNSYLFELITNSETVDKKDEIMKHFFRKARNENKKDFSCDEFIDNYKQKILNKK